MISIRKIIKVIVLETVIILITLALLLSALQVLQGFECKFTYIKSNEEGLYKPLMHKHIKGDDIIINVQ